VTVTKYVPLGVEFLTANENDRIAACPAAMVTTALSLATVDVSPKASVNVTA